MEIIQIIFFALVALFILVTFHEFGHYWVARKCGVRVLRFSIGFGKPLLRWQRGDTEFVLAGIPLGGYVKMFGESTSEEDVPESERHLSFSHKTVWQRMAIVVAGPIANLLLAILFYFIVFLGGTKGIAPIVGSVAPDSVAERAGVIENTEITRVDGESVTSWADVFDQLMKRMGETGGIQLRLIDAGAGIEQQLELPIQNWHGDTDQPDFLGSLGITPYTPEILANVGLVVDDSPAAKSGLQVGDLILETDGQSIANWEQWRNIVRSAPEGNLPMLVERDGNTVRLQLVPAAIEEAGEVYGQAGVAPQSPEWPEALKRDKHYSVPEAFTSALVKTGDMSLFILDSLKKLVTGQLSTKSLGGPITVAKVAGASAELGWQRFIEFLAMFSVMLGVMNLMPIPVLDGGHLLFYIVEAIKGSPLRQAVQEGAMRLGMTIVFGIMLLALYNDFMRL